MSDLDSITSREMAEHLNNKAELTEEEKKWQLLNSKKNQAAAARGVNTIGNTDRATNNNLSNNMNTNKKLPNTTTRNAAAAADDDDRRSVLSSRIMRSGLTNIGQLVRKPPGLQSVQERRTVEAAMRDPRYAKAWRGPGTGPTPRPDRETGTAPPGQSFQYQPRPGSSAPFLQPQHEPRAPRPPPVLPQHQNVQQQQQHQQHQRHDRDRDQHQHQHQPLPLYGPFASLQDIDAERDRVLREQKSHLFEAVECEVRVKVLHWHRHAMMEREARDANAAENNKE